MKNKLRTLLSLVVMFAMIGSYFVSPNLAQVEAAAQKLKVTVPAKNVAVNTTIALKTNVKAKFKSSNKKIATVSSKGVVKGKKAGKATITVTSKANKAQKKIVKITVKNRLVITAPDNAEATLKMGETTKIKTNLSSKYASSDESIAEVSSNGTVTAKSAGTATITVTSKKYKKLKKTVTIIVTKPEEPTTEPTTETTTTEQKSDDTVKPGETPTTETPTKQPSSEATTTEKTTTEATTTERPTTEASTTEKPTEEDPTTEEKTVVGIEAKYRGDKVPNNLDMIKLYGISLYKVYNDGTKEEVNIDFNEHQEMDYDYVSTETTNNSTYAKYNVSYKGFSTEMKVELIDTEELYPYQISVSYKGEKIKEGEVPNLEDVECSVVLSDKKTYSHADKSKLRFILYYDHGDKYEYTVVYDYAFTDENGNELYVCPFFPLYVPYE